MDSINSWRVMDFELKRALLFDGVGWAAMPRSKVEHDLASGRLVMLRPRGWGDSEQVLKVSMVVARASDRPAGPAARWLYDRFAAVAQNCP
jgi:DNA-binding transcriptional LysR family regulator